MAQAAGSAEPAGSAGSGSEVQVALGSVVSAAQVQVEVEAEESAAQASAASASVVQVRAQGRVGPAGPAAGTGKLACRKPGISRCRGTSLAAMPSGRT